MRNLGRGLGIIGLGICLGVVAGCATGPFGPTGYQASGWLGGYSDMKVQDDIFKVTFSGNGYTNAVRARDFALLRCAEVTLGNGYKYFIIIDEKASSKWGGDGWDPSNQTTIKCFKEKPENTDVLVYDAEQVKTNTKNSYGIKEK